MKAKTLPVISMSMIDYDSIASLGDRAVWNRLVFHCRSSKKRIIPAKVRYDSFNVSRGENRVTIHLRLGTKETARVNFVPTPAFR